MSLVSKIVADSEEECWVIANDHNHINFEKTIVLSQLRLVVPTILLPMVGMLGTMVQKAWVNTQYTQNKLKTARCAPVSIDLMRTHKTGTQEQVRDLLHSYDLDCFVLKPNIVITVFEVFPSKNPEEVAKVRDILGKNNIQLVVQ